MAQFSEGGIVAGSNAERQGGAVSHVRVVVLDHDLVEGVVSEQLQHEPSNSHNVSATLKAKLIADEFYLSRPRPCP